MRFMSVSAQLLPTMKGLPFAWQPLCSTLIDFGWSEDVFLCASKISLMIRISLRS